jgi:antitoxin (DNA-binding transcriptional repressor) of toxin-antitoxin stability system
MVIMKTIGAGAFKAKCLSIMDDVHNGHGEVVVTKRGQPFVKIAPIRPEKPESIFGALRGLATIHGDLVSPIVEPREWDEDIFPPGTPERDEFERRRKKAAPGVASRKAAERKSARAKK